MDVLVQKGGQVQLVAPLNKNDDCSATGFSPNTITDTLTEKAAISVCVVCCSTNSMPYDALLSVAKALIGVAEIRAILLSETGNEPPHGIEVVKVPIGTKLSKIRHLNELLESNLYCICDPDLTVDEHSCRVVLQKAIANVRDRKEVVAFGTIIGKDDGTLLSQVVSVDKWLSHNVLRPFLWSAGIGITLPGQFLILSPGVISNIDKGLDSYLDDLCLGLLARQRGVVVHRVPVVIGEEAPRCSWISLLTQRVRWMRGLASLLSYFSSHSSAVALIGVHFLAYHGLPIFMMAVFVSLSVIHPLAGFIVFFSLVSILSVFSGRSLLVTVTFLVLFPFIHALATLLWWVPLSRTTLTKR